ncbi:energy transducer TonB [Litorimonas sp. WD9-15]|uniref:energy transducer TonB n=1 Tax=Litorimonas sp. WD9-15 TaxID=3418716 RepID=UPI003D029278
MAQLIATEFQPQDKSKSIKFEINPVEKIVEIKERIDEPDPLERVETPPPPPTTGVDVVEPVTEPVIKTVSADPDFELPEIDFGGTGYVKPDTDEQPIVRIPPVMPARFQQGDASGYCTMRFSVSPEGQPFDVTATQCTNRILERASTKAVLRWKYNPKIVNGRAVSRSGVETKIRFDLADERGNRLPLPSGY